MKNQYSVVCRFADINVKINFLYKNFLAMCRNYVCEAPPDFEITITQEDIDYERQRSEDGDKYPAAYLEMLAIYRKFCTAAADYGVILFHASAIAVDGEAYLFSAPSGTGKSTHTSLWRKVFQDRAVMVNDDKPLFRFKEDGVYVYGTPWDGKHRLSENLSCKLKGICFLERGEQNSIRSLSTPQALPRIMSQTYLPKSERECQKVIGMVGKLCAQVPLYLLKCNISEEAALLSYNTMKRGLKL